MKWQVTTHGDNKHGRYITTDHGGVICQVYDHDTPWGKINANLIAAAPDMLEALQECLAFWDQPPNGPGGNTLRNVWLAKIKDTSRAAIAKAEGKEAA